MRLTRQQQIQGVQSLDLAAAVWPLLVGEIWQEFVELTFDNSFTHKNAEVALSLRSWLSHHQKGQVWTCVTAEYFKSPATTSLKRLKTKPNQSVSCDRTGPVYGFLHMALVHTGPGPHCDFMQLHYVWFTALFFWRRAALQSLKSQWSCSIMQTSAELPQPSKTFNLVEEKYSASCTTNTLLTLMYSLSQFAI